MNRFSVLDRSLIKNRLTDTTFDILIIGGGITGAGIALDASSKGMRVALVEKNDFASGTSGKSTKLIHGGLRYLKQFNFLLVREVGREREIVHNLAPHLVVPEKMLLPLLKDGTYGKFMSSIGLKMYDVLAGVRGDDQRKMLNKKQTLEIEPLLPKDILRGAGYYAEYRTDDARLTIEVLKTACNYDATAINYCKATDFIYEDGKVIGAKVVDLINAIGFDIKAKYVINATGPWVDELREVDHSKKGKQLHLTKGVHLVFPHHKLPVRHSIYFDVPDGRMIFAIPRGQITYVGTTDTDFKEDKCDIKVTKSDAGYLIDAINNMFHSIQLTIEDIQSSWAGLRPLIHKEGKSASELSRNDEIFESESGLLSIAGGKLTGYRKMAQRIVDLILIKKMNIRGKRFIKTNTKNITLNGSSFKNYKEVKKYCEQIFEQIKSHGFTRKNAEYLVHNYGQQTDIILNKYQEIKENNPELRLAKSELWFCIQYEMVYLPLDFFERRTGRLFFNIESVRRLKYPILKELALALNWDNKELENQKSILDKTISNVVSF